MALIKQLALVSQVPGLKTSVLQKVSAALQRQVTRDFAPAWEVKATVDTFSRLSDVPIGYWPVLIMKDIRQEGAAGIHLDKDGQPFSLVQFGKDWSITASHEVLEMLADPFGNRVMAGDSPKPGQGRVEFLVEVCDPSETFAYTVNGVKVSDFYTPRYFDPIASNGVQYSFMGVITKPRQVLAGGYLSWHDPKSDHWFQLTDFGVREFHDLGVLARAAGESLRSAIDRLTTPKSEAFRTSQTAQGMSAISVTSAAAAVPELEAEDESSYSRAERLQQQVDALVK